MKLKTPNEIIDNISHIYKTYNIPPSLQQHMLLVAGIGNIIAKEIPSCDIELVTALCMIHDMGNIVKFNVESDLSKKLSKQDNISIEKIKKIQTNIKTKFGNEHHSATENIVQDFTNNKKIITLLKQLDFKNATHIAKQECIELQIALYADYRIGPFGLVSLQERFNDLHKRYHNRPEHKLNEQEVKQLQNAYSIIEKELEKKISFLHTLTEKNIKQFLNKKIEI